MKKILIIEDNKVVASIYRKKLQDDDFLVDVAPDGEDAIQQITAAPPDLVVLDLGLPKMNGIQVLKWIRANRATAALPVIVFSNSYVTEVIQAAWKAGANKCLTKASCSSQDLLEIIHATLAAKGVGEDPFLIKWPNAVQMPPPLPMPAPAPAPAPIPTAPLPEARPEIQSHGTADALFQMEMRRAFLKNAPNFISDLRKHLQVFSQGAADASAGLFEFYRATHSLTGNAGIVGFAKLAQLSAALEALLKELHEKPKHIGPSPLRTIANAIDTIAALFGSASDSPGEDRLPPAILALDDDKICRRAICTALAKANLRALSVSDPAMALLILAENSFDLIFSDINMPDMNGFEFCAKVRTLPGHQNTPVIFVTSASDFENRAGAKLSGGADLIAKPFLLVELVVKTLTFLYRRTGPAPVVPIPETSSRTS